MNRLTDDDQASAIEWFKTHFGISLTMDKKYLVQTRLESVAFKFGFPSVKHLLADLTNSSANNSDLVKAVCSAITTHETSFFRDIHPFKFFETDYFPNWIEKKSASEPWSVWSGACSSGQEIYSLMMLLKEKFPDFFETNIKAHATDVSTHTLEKAELGEYNQAEVSRGLQAAYLVKYFQQLPSGNWKLNEAIRDKVTFSYHNLIGNWSNLGCYDLILLRNVLIYFDVELKINVLNRLKHHLKPGGILLLGGSETTANLDPDWEVCKSQNTVFYRLK